MHLSYSTTEKNHSIFMSKREVILCPPCYSINNSTFSSPVTIFPWWLWNAALKQLALERLHFVPVEEAEFKITGKCLCENTLFLPLVPQAGYPEQPCSHGSVAGMRPGKSLASIPAPAHCFWTDIALGIGTQLCHLKTRDLVQASHLWIPYVEGKEEAPLGTSPCTILQTDAATAAHSCRLSPSPAHRHPPHISAPFLTWAPSITLLPHQGLAQNTEWGAKTTPFDVEWWKKYSGWEGVH